MDSKDSLQYYLKGALAGKLIESRAEVSACRQCYKEKSAEAAYVSVPSAVTVGEEVNVCVRINRAPGGTGCGRVVLQGEDLDREATCHFQAPFSLQQGGEGTCITFRWRAPRQETRITWSADIRFDDTPAVDTPACYSSTTVSRPLH